MALNLLHTFRTVPEMIEFFGDYSEDDGTFKELSNPSCYAFKLSSVICPHDSATIRDKLLKRNLLYGIYRTFIHVPDCNTIDVSSSLTHTNSEKVIALTVKRAVVLAVAKKIFKVNDLSQLVNQEPFPMEGNETEVLNEFTPVFWGVNANYHYDFLVRVMASIKNDIRYKQSRPITTSKGTNTNVIQPIPKFKRWKGGKKCGGKR